jgi:mono/diheme cytochrome c family protein
MFVRLLLATFFAASASIAVADGSIDFEQQIQPIFVKHCAKCHGEKKAQSKLRLDNVAGIEAKWQAEPELIVAGKPDESELYKRLVLPADSPKRMPKGADPLPQAQVELIANWIKQGAVLTVAAATTASTDTSATAPAEKKSLEKLPLPEASAAPQSAIDKLTAAGARVMPLFAGSNLLEVSFAGRSEPAGDAEVALLADVAEQVYALNLADAKLSDSGLAPLADLKNLGWLHLERSNVTDAGLEPLAKLPRLEYLNLYGTGIGDAGLAHVAGLKHLARLYLWQTKVSYDRAMGLERDIPGLIVNLGFDHPEVVKHRLTGELESARKQAETAATEATAAKTRLEQAEKNKEATAARVTEIEKQLQNLTSPSDGS